MNDPLADDLEKIAREMAADMARGDAPCQEKVAALRALSSYYISTRKLGKKQDIDDDPGFGRVKEVIAAASGGNGAKPASN